VKNSFGNLLHSLWNIDPNIKKQFCLVPLAMEQPPGKIVDGQPAVFHRSYQAVELGKYVGFRSIGDAWGKPNIHSGTFAPRHILALLN
jgi:hypothetical protein